MAGTFHLAVIHNDGSGNPAARVTRRPGRISEAAARASAWWANLVGHLGVDLGRETLEMSVESRSREGLGISVGNVFSNTVQIRGPLRNPRIVPNPTSIAWRAWAAVSTGGLSILGENLLRRIGASSTPCMSLKRVLVEQLCPINPIAASSEMVCPTK